MKEQPSNLLGVLQVLYKWRKAIRNLCLIALIGSLALSMTLDNYYQSSTIFYPASPQLANPELMFGYTSQVTQYYGSDHDLDRLMEIALSKELVDYMVETFGLYGHYKIDSTSKKGPFKVREQFGRLYDVQKNKYEAIEISVEDKDRHLAQKMANAARIKVDEIAQRLTKSAQSRILAAFADNISRKNKELESLSDSIQKVRSTYHIYDIASQGTQLSTLVTEAQARVSQLGAKLEILEKNPNIPRDTIAYIEANLKGYQRQLSNLMGTSGGDNFNAKNFNAGLPQVSILTDLHFQARKQLSFDLERLNQIQSAYNTEISAMHVIENAELPLVKSRPKRSILVLASLAVAFLFSIIGVFLAEAYKDINWSRISGADAE